MTLEHDRFIEADAAFRLALHTAFNAERELGEVSNRTRTSETETRAVKIPKRDIDDNEWRQHLPQFEAEGRHAARWGATSATLEQPDRSEQATFEGWLTWRVTAGLNA